MTGGEGFNEVKDARSERMTTLGNGLKNGLARRWITMPSSLETIRAVWSPYMRDETGSDMDDELNGSV